MKATKYGQEGGSSFLRFTDLEGDIDVICWCDRKVGKVPFKQWIDGHTWSCGRPECQPPQEEA
jgi:hypothetical protein